MKEKMRLASVSRACRQWARLALQLATEFKANYRTITVGRFVHLLHLMRGEETEKTKLRKIDCRQVEFDDNDDDEGLWSAIGALCPQLEDLTLYLNHLRLQNKEHLLTACKKLQNLRKLTIDGRDSFYCHSISCLRELSLKVLDVDVDGQANLIEAWKLFSNQSPLSRSIEELRLINVFFNDGQLFLDRMAESCSNMVKLKLSSCPGLSINFSTYFTSAHFPNLRELFLFHTIVKGFSGCHLPMLERLGIGRRNRPTTDDTVRSILLGCPSLVWLDACDFKPSLDFLTRWAEIGRNCQRAWEAPLVMNSGSFCGWPAEIQEYVKNLGLAWKDGGCKIAFDCPLD